MLILRGQLAKKRKKTRMLKVLSFINRTPAGSAEVLVIRTPKFCNMLKLLMVLLGTSVTTKNMRLLPLCATRRVVAI